MRTPALVVVCVCAALIAAQAHAGTTGKLAGRITNTKGDPLQGATIILAGLPLGAAADASGSYVILNIPPGSYDVKVLLVGHRPVTVTGVRVSADQTTPLNAQLEETALQMQEVVIKAQRPVVEVKLTSSVAKLGKEEIARLPVQELQDVVNLQAGVVDGHIRGGRVGEVQYQVDGVSVNNAYDNKSTLRIDRSLLEEVQVISGTFDAEYGQAMSGVVNAVLRRGGSRFRYSAEAYTGGFAYAGARRGIEDVPLHPAGAQSYQLTLSGPLAGRTDYLLSGRRYVFDDYVTGTRRFLPTDSSDVATNSFHPTGDGAEVPLAFSREWSGLGKVSTRVFGNVQVDYQAILNVVDGRRANYAYRLNPDGLSRQHTVSLVHGVDWTHTLAARSYYTISLRQNSFRYRDNVYDDAYDPRYDAAGPPVDDPDYENGAFVQGVEPTRFVQTTNAFVGKGSFVSQVTRDHLVKIGGEWSLPRLTFGVPTYIVFATVNGTPTVLRKTDEPPSFPGERRYHPWIAAAFAQDEAEWRDLTLRAGVRLDYFNARATVPSDLANPANSIDGAPASVPVPASAKVALSPRLGVSYPITDRAALSFAYGHFSQLPPLGDIFSRADYSVLAELQAGGIDYGVLGNPDIKPERTVQYQFGYKQAVTDLLGLDLTVFSKDIRDLLGVEFLSTYNGAEYARLTNVDFGNVLGFTIALDQRPIGPFSAALDYTWQRARGNSSDPRETATRASAGEDPRPREVPLNWDQRHTLNVTVNLAHPGSFLVSSILRVGSGQPYTPTLDTGFGGGLETNSGRKPTSVLLDVRGEKNIGPASRGLSVFARAFNLLDTRFTNGFVFATSGSPYYSRYPAADRTTLGDPTRFAAPRRIEVGVSLAPPARTEGATP